MEILRNHWRNLRNIFEKITRTVLIPHHNKRKKITFPIQLKSDFYAKNWKKSMLIFLRYVL